MPYNNNKLINRLLASGLLLLLGMASAEARIKYGKWEITVQAHATGLPIEIPPETYTKCLSRRNLTPGANADKKSCGKQKVKREGDKVSWSVSCTKDGDKMNGGGTITFKGNDMEGKGYFEAGGKGMPTMKMQLKYTGKRLGRCRKK